MIKTFISVIKWYTKLGKKLVRELPFYTLAIITLTLVAQISTLLSFLLPIKIIMIAGLDSMPAYIPNFFGDIDKKTVIGILIGLTIILFGIQATAGKFSFSASEKGITKLLLKSEKLVIFENQSDIATNSYKQFCESVAGLTFTFTALSGAAYLYPDAILTLFYFAAAYTVVLNIFWASSEKYQKSLKENIPQHFNTFSTLAFLATFCFITIDFLYFDHPEFIFGILILIVIRQVNARLGLTVGNLYSLRLNSAKVDSLFFRDNIFSSDKIASTENIWTLFRSDDFQEKLKDKILRGTLLTVDIDSVQWIETGIHNIAFLFLSTLTDSKQKLLIKIFNKGQSSSAIHEATLLLETSLDLPSPELICATDLKGYHLHIFDISGALPSTAKSYKQNEATLRSQITDVALPQELQDKYKRSKHLLYDRLNPEMFKRLKLVTPGDQQEVVIRCEKRLSDIKTILKELPQTLAVDTAWRNVWISEDGAPLVLHWGSWRIDVAGISWEANDTLMSEFTDFIEVASLPKFREIDHCDRKMMIASLIRKSEREFNQQLYLSCIVTWQKVLDHLTELGK